MNLSILRVNSNNILSTSLQLTSINPCYGKVALIWIRITINQNTCEYFQILAIHFYNFFLNETMNFSWKLFSQYCHQLDARLLTALHSQVLWMNQKNRSKNICTYQSGQTPIGLFSLNANMFQGFCRGIYLPKQKETT